MRRASRVSRDSSDAMRCVFVTIRVFVYSCIENDESGRGVSREARAR